jgi:hypothetical protein
MVSAIGSSATVNSFQVPSFPKNLYLALGFASFSETLRDSGTRPLAPPAKVGV